MNTYRLFVSVYESVEIMLNSRQRDIALSIQNVSPFVDIEAKSLCEAKDKFNRSDELENFLSEKSSAYFYYIDNNGNPQSIKDGNEP